MASLTTDLDRVRLLIGDTDVTDPILSDVEVNTCIDNRQIYDSRTEAWLTNVYAAAADAAAACAAHFARQFNFAEDAQRFDRAQKHAHYLALERNLRSRAGCTFVDVLDTEAET